MFTWLRDHNKSTYADVHGRDRALRERGVRGYAVR